MTKQQRLVLLISILASFVAFLDGSVVNVGLPAIVRDLGGGLAVQQWVVDAYLMTLGSLMLVAGSFSDLFGRKKILAFGLLGFLIASIFCALAPNSGLLIASRTLQGVAGALLVPSSLALIIGAFNGKAQGRAIGIWTSWTGIAFIVGPLLGGSLIDLFSWRAIFAINVLPIAAALWLMRGLDLPEHIRKTVRIDWLGVVLGGLGLAGPVYGLIEQSHYGWANPMVWGSIIGGVLVLALFLLHERRTRDPMLPLELFQSRNFSVGNIATTSIYAGLSVATFLIVIFLQQIEGYSAVVAGFALVPSTLIMFVLSPRLGSLSSTFGPRIFMALGPLIAGAGFLFMLRVSQPVSYWTQLLPGIALFGLGLSVTVTPLTSAVLGSIRAEQAGVASATNNAIARIAGLIAIAAVGIIIGPTITLDGFRRGLVATAILLFIGAAISAIGISNNAVKKNAESRIEQK